MTNVRLSISPESLAEDVLPGTEAELAAERIAAPIKSSAQREAVACVATATNQGQPVPDQQLQAAGMSSEDHDLLTNELTQLHESRTERIEDWIHRDAGRIEEFDKELATVVADRAEKVGVSTARYLEKLQKKLLQYMISSYLLDPIPIQLSTGPSTLAATSVSLQATVTLQPSVSASPDVIEGFLVSLFNMSFQLTVGYGG